MEQVEQVCLDIRMPRMDGQRVLQHIRRVEARADLWPGSGAARVVMVTSRSAPKEILQAYREQCDAYLRKPITSSALFGTLRKLSLLPPLNSEVQLAR